MAKQYRRRGTDMVFEAMQLTSETVIQLAEWSGGIIIEERDPITNEIFPGLNVRTSVGNARVSNNMYVVKVGLDDFVVAQPGTFEALYEEVPQEHMKPFPNGPRQI